MPDLPIECPFCHRSFKLNETLAAPLIEETKRTLNKEFEARTAALDAQARSIEEARQRADAAKRDLDAQRAAISKAREEIEAQVSARLAEQRSTVEREITAKAKQRLDAELAKRDAERLDLEHVLKAQGDKLAEAQVAQREALRKQRELDEKIRGADLAAEKRAAELVAPQIERARKDADEAARLRMAEKDKVIEAQKAQLAEAQRKLEQGSQQLQGEVQELDLEKRLREAFPRDTIEPVPKGQFGGDAVHRVFGPHGGACGTILWEFKRTRNWSSAWTDKLKQDQRAAKAEIAVIVTQAMPSGIETFGEVSGVWVTTPAVAIPLAAVLRCTLMETALARRATEGQHDKMAVLYQYLTGPEFRQRIEAISEAFTAMQADLIAERTAFERQWAKRQKQIDRVMASTVGMWGELQAIAGASLQQIEGLEMKMLASTGAESANSPFKI